MRLQHVGSTQTKEKLGIYQKFLSKKQLCYLLTRMSSLQNTVYQKFGNRFSHKTEQSHKRWKNSNVIEACKHLKTVTKSSISMQFHINWTTEQYKEYIYRGSKTNTERHHTPWEWPWPKIVGKFVGNLIYLISFWAKVFWFRIKKLTRVELGTTTSCLSCTRAHPLTTELSGWKMRRA